MTAPPRTALRCVFRVAAGPRIGFGHLLRARALARALDVVPVVSVRGGKAAADAARALGCRTVNGTSVLREVDLLFLDDPSATHGRQWVESARRLGVRCVSVHDGATPPPRWIWVSTSSTTASRPPARRDGPPDALAASSSPSGAAVMSGGWLSGWLTRSIVRAPAFP